MNITNTVWSRTASDSRGTEISAHLYNLIMGGMLVYGFLVNYLIVINVPANAIHPLVLLIGYFISCFVGIRMFTKSDVPIISFIGYNLVVIPFGLVINSVVSMYSPGLVMEAIRVTGIVTGCMMILGTLFPAFFQRIHRALTMALITVIIYQLVEMLIFRTSSHFIDWIVVLIFCGYIGYDWGRAQAIPKTVDNAIDSAASLYMDIIILFLRILRILGRRR